MYFLFLYFLLLKIAEKTFVYSIKRKYFFPEKIDICDDNICTNRGRLLKRNDSSINYKITHKLWLTTAVNVNKWEPLDDVTLSYYAKKIYCTYIILILTELKVRN